MTRRPFARPLLLAAAALAVAGATPVSAQTAAAAQAHPVSFAVPPAAPEDVASIEAIITALYASISGPVGQERQWNRMRSLFIPGGRMMPTGRNAEGAVRTRILSVDEYIATSGPVLVRVGFSETEVARREERFGSVAHVWSTYAGGAEDGSFSVRGINSIQLLHDGERWWIVSVYWQAEQPDLPLPARYLSSGGG
jgi:hypothetical protein